jgi:CBS domain-containing protein
MLAIDAIMTTDLITLQPADNLDKARAIMRDNRIHHLPVIDEDGQLVGLVTLTDLLAATDSRLRGEDRLHAKDIPVEDAMIRDIATVDEHASLRQAALFLEKHKIGCLPVVTDGKLRGIVTDTDFVAVAINLLEQVEAGEPEEL